MIHIAIVSHGHEDLLLASELCGLLPQSPTIRIWLKDNQPSAVLKDYCTQQQIHYFDEQPGLGFGENNNFLFAKIKAAGELDTHSLFIVLNPDVVIATSTILNLAQLIKQDLTPIATINLFRDTAFLQADANIRMFPTWRAPLKIPLIRAITEPYDKAAIPAATDVDWASGALLAFTPEHFENLGGFDEDYFMYFEDVDLCFRSRRVIGKGVRYYPQLKAVHLAARKSRKLGSPHTLWFIQGFLRFIWRRYTR